MDLKRRILDRLEEIIDALSLAKDLLEDSEHSESLNALEDANDMLADVIGTMENNEEFQDV